MFFYRKSFRRCFLCQKVHTLPGVPNAVFWKIFCFFCNKIACFSHLYNVSFYYTGDDFMKKLLALIFVFAMIFSGCKKQEENWDYMPLLYFGDAFFAQKNVVISSLPYGWTMAGKTTKEVPSHEAPPEENGASNALYEGTAIYTNPNSPEIIYAEFEEGKFITFEIYENFSAESSGCENPYTSCVPEWSLESAEADSSHSHSTDFSSSEEPSEIFQIKGRTTEIYPAEAENLEIVLGSAKELERWKTAINNLSEVSEIVVCYIETEERKLDPYNVTAVINNLRALSPEIKPERIARL